MPSHTTQAARPGIGGGIRGGEHFAADGEVQILAALAGIAAGFRVAAGTHHGDAEREEGVEALKRLLTGTLLQPPKPPKP